MSKPRVVVVGAGAAGLAAAQQLQDHADVLVVEGRSRIGGRIWTKYFADGAFIDLGAAWVHGTGQDNPSVPLLQKMGVKVSQEYGDDVSTPFMFEANGPVGKPQQASRMGTWKLMGEAFQMWKVSRALDAMVEQRVKAWPSMPDISVWEGVQQIKSCGPLGFRGWDTLDERSQQLLKSMMQITYENSISAKMEDLSLTWMSEDEAFGGDYSGSQSGVPVGGWQKFIDHIAKGLEIRLDSPVSMIKANGPGVDVVLRSGETLPCAACVCTLPLGVLKAGSVVFEPPLPSPKLAAISRLGFGIVNRVAVRFDRCFWPDSHFWFRLPACKERRDPASQDWPMWVNWKPMTKSNTIIAFFYHEVAQEAEAKSDDELAQWMKVLLATMFVKEEVEAAEILEVAVSRWHGDEFSRGAYSHIRKGASPDDRDACATPHGAVFFAGEHAIKGRPSTVDGAYASGQRAAQEVLSHLQPSKS